MLRSTKPLSRMFTSASRTQSSITRSQLYLNVFANSENNEQKVVAFERLVKYNYKQPASNYRWAIKYFLATNELDKVEKCITELQKKDKDVANYNAIIYAYAKLKQFDQISSLLNDMEKFNLSPSQKTFKAVLHGYADNLPAHS